MRDVVSLVSVKERRRCAARAAFRRLSEDAQEALVKRVYEKSFQNLTAMEQAAADQDLEDSDAAAEDYWRSLTPEEQEAEIDAFEDWERSEREGRPA